MAYITQCYSTNDVAGAGGQFIEIFGRQRIQRCSATSHQYPDNAQVKYPANTHPGVNLALGPQNRGKLILRLPELEHRVNCKLTYRILQRFSLDNYLGRISLHNV